MFSEERISAAELQRRGERSETVRDVLYALADRVHWWTVGSFPQQEDSEVLLRARAMGWVPWHEREPGKTQYEESLRKIEDRKAEETCEWCGRKHPKSEMNSIPWGGDPNRVKRICDRCCDEGN